MAYNFTTIERKWQRYWLENKTFRALDPHEAGSKPKAYLLDMFPYPSGAGLHVGHPEGYTATDIVSRHLRMKGFNVLHPMGWDAFGLPAEEYARKNNVHPAVSTKKNVDNFRKQIRALGLGYDWDREVNTTDASYYQWTQWIFLQLFNSYYDRDQRKARPIAHLLNELQNENLVVAPDGTLVVNPGTEGIEAIVGEVRIERSWKELTPTEQRQIIDDQRLAYLAEVIVNWCPQLGTVLSNEEVIDGVSERGGFAVERRPLRQWLMRITAYCDRLIDDLDQLDWPESIKGMQRNWIGRGVGVEVDFELANEAAGVDELVIKVFTTRPETLFGVTYMVLAPEHTLLDAITTPEQRPAVDEYRSKASIKSERDRLEGTREKSGVFTGAFAINPVTDERLPIWVADYVLADVGTGAVMAVPAHDQRDFDFAKAHGLRRKCVVVLKVPGSWRHEQPPQAFFERVKTVDDRSTLTSINFLPLNHPYFESMAALSEMYGEEAKSASVESVEGGVIICLHAPLKSRDSLKLGAPQIQQHTDAAFEFDGVAINSGFLDGMTTADAKARMLSYLEETEIGRRRVNYKLRDWLFSRQRYWGEPFPIVLDDNGFAHAVDESELPVTLPEMSDFKPTGTPEGPLSKATDWLKYSDAFTRETNTMPQWAGSCWYYLRYLDPTNSERFVDPEKEQYWMPVDLYVGGVEHAVLHLLYARFWHKALFDLGHLSTNEPFKRLVNQGLILGETEFHFFELDGKAMTSTDFERIGEEGGANGAEMVGYHKTTGRRVVATRVIDLLVERKGDKYVLKSQPDVAVDARSFKMSKSRGNVVNPDAILENYGADAFRLYEMYMGPLEAQKPWNTRDIIGQTRFLNGVARNFMGDEEAHKVATIADVELSPALEQTMHRTIKKVGEDITHLRFNTAIAELIKLNNEITKLDVLPRALATNFALLLAPFAPHLAEELWAHLGHPPAIARAAWPTFDPAKLESTTMELPIQVNGKLRGKITVAADATEADILGAAQLEPAVKPWVEGKTVRKALYVPNKLVNFVVG